MKKKGLLVVVAFLLLVFVVKASDIDGDGVEDSVDNCYNYYNPVQEDSNSDGIGDACDIEEFNISLATNWNLITIYLIPENTSVTSVLSSIEGNYIKVMAYNASDTIDPWESYDPALPMFSDLKNVVSGFGYWIRMMKNDTWVVYKKEYTCYLESHDETFFEKVSIDIIILQD